MYSTVRDHVATAVKLYRVDLEALPDYWADDDCDRFRTGLNAGFGQGSSDIYSMWAADKSGGEEREDESDDNDFALGGIDSDEEEGEDERIPGEGGRVPKRELVCCPRFIQYHSATHNIAGFNYSGYSYEPNTDGHGE